MAQRHQIESFEFQAWMEELGNDDALTIQQNTREELYDLWVEGYSTWEVAGILG